MAYKNKIGKNCNWSKQNQYEKKYVDLTKNENAKYEKNCKVSIVCKNV